MGSEELLVKNSITDSLSNNQTWLKQKLSNCSDVVFHMRQYGPDLKLSALVVYCESLVQQKDVNYLKSLLQDMVPHVVGPATMIELEEVVRFFEQKGVSTQPVDVLDQLEKSIDRILFGHVVIFFDKWNKALSFNAHSVQSRNISEAINEPVVRGPHDSTVEDMGINLGLLRTRLKSDKFKIQKFVSGGETHTEIAYGYLEGAVNPETLELFENRFESAKSKEILETAYIEELIEDSTYSPFPQFRHTERADVAVAALLDGKIIVLVSGTPSILICPGLFSEFFQTSEDYYIRTVYSSLVRLVRIVSFLLALTLPSLYIAFSTFHTELIPTVLLLAVLDTREGIPFPTFIEALLMEFFFEILREAGIRLPRPVGAAVSIVGALVIGQAAIQAKIASPIMVIVVALTGIASFSLPNYNMATSLRILRFILMICAAILGIFGLMIGLMFILLHLVSLRSLGQPYMAPLAPFRIKQLRELLVRAPLKNLLRLPRNKHMHKVRKN